MKISVRVIPQSSKNEVVEDVTNCEGIRSLKVKISQPPQDGKANQELIKILAKYFNTKAREINITKGLTSRNKTVEIS